MQSQTKLTLELKILFPPLKISTIYIKCFFKYFYFEILEKWQIFEKNGKWKNMQKPSGNDID